MINFLMKHLLQFRNWLMHLAKYEIGINGKEPCLRGSFLAKSVLTLLMSCIQFLTVLQGRTAIVSFKNPAEVSFVVKSTVFGNCVYGKAGSQEIFPGYIKSIFL